MGIRIELLRVLHLMYVCIYIRAQVTSSEGMVGVLIKELLSPQEFRYISCLLYPWPHGLEEQVGLQSFVFLIAYADTSITTITGQRFFYKEPLSS